MEELLELTTDTMFDAAQQSQIAEIAHRTNVVTIVLMTAVIIINVTAITLLVIMHKNSKRPREFAERYKEYVQTVGNVVSVEKVAYYIKRYVKKEEPLEGDGKKSGKTGDIPKLIIAKKAPSPVEKSTGSEVVMKSPEELAKEQEEAAIEIRKFRYRVFYEFTVAETGSLYTGECYIYDPSAVNPGDIIEIMYKPDDPMINFTDYSMPAGYLKK